MQNLRSYLSEKFAPPKVPGVCDIDGGELYQRPDDTRETAVKRLVVFHNQTTPIIEYYKRERGLLQEVNGDQPVEKVKHLLDCLR